MIQFIPLGVRYGHVGYRTEPKLPRELRVYLPWSEKSEGGSLHMTLEQARELHAALEVAFREMSPEPDAAWSSREGPF